MVIRQNKVDSAGSAQVSLSKADGDKLTNYLTSFGHTCSDINQGALSAVLPFLVVGSGYSYFEATILIFAANSASAIIQPLFGWIGDKRPCPWFMALGVFLAGCGMAGIGFAPSYGWVAVSAMLSGIGVAMFHPEGGRIANLAAGTRKGNGMSIFAVGGNIGFLIGPLLTAFFVSTFGLPGTAVFLLPSTICAVVLLSFNKRFVSLGVSISNTSQGSSQTEHWNLFAMVLGVLSLRSIVNYGLMAFISLFFVGVLAQSETLSATVLSFFSIAGAIATALSGRAAEKVGAMRLMVMCCVAVFVGIVAFTFNTLLVVALIITLFLPVVLDLFYPSTVALGMSYVPGHLGMASGLSYGVAVCIGGVVEPCLGLVGDSVGLIPVMVALAVVSLAAGGIGLALKHRHIRTVLLRYRREVAPNPHS